MSTAERIGDLVAPLVADLGATVYDVEHAGGVVRIWLQRAEGLDLSLITEATRRISGQLDAEDILPGPYTLEVSSPGLERRLRTTAHFEGAVGELVKVKLRAGVEGERRIDGELVVATPDQVIVRSDDGAERTVAMSDIERANTHVDWSPPPKPGSTGKGTARPSSQPSGPATDEDTDDRTGPDESAGPPTQNPTPRSKAT
jgi:ribosome maturation factor RimP